MKRLLSGLLLAGLIAAACASHEPTSTPVAATRTASGIFPGAEWERIADPKTVGYCADKLDLVTARAKGFSTTAIMAIVGGRVLYEYGDVTAVSYLASVRKSVLAMLFGKYVKNGTIKVDKTLAELGIDDHGGLLPSEKEATIADLLGARSGVYHEASNAATTSRRRRRAARRSTAPTTSIATGTSMPSARSSNRRRSRAFTTRSRGTWRARSACATSIAPRTIAVAIGPGRSTWRIT